MNWAWVYLKDHMSSMLDLFGWWNFKKGEGFLFLIFTPMMGFICVFWVLALWTVEALKLYALFYLWERDPMVRKKSRERERDPLVIEKSTNYNVCAELRYLPIVRILNVSLLQLVPIKNVNTRNYSCRLFIWRILIKDVCVCLLPWWHPCNHIHLMTLVGMTVSAALFLRFTIVTTFFW